MRRKFTTVLAASLTAVMLMTSCASDDRSERRRDRDRDDDSTPLFSRPSESETEPSETGAAPLSSLGAAWAPEDLDPDIADAYAAVLTAYETGIRDFEAFHTWTCPSINIIDLDGDGVPELAIKYVTDPGYVTFSVFSYDQGAGQPCLRLETMGETDTGSWGASNDIVLLDDGTIMISNFYGSGGEYHYHIDLFETELYHSLGSWECEEQMPDMSSDCVPVSAQHSGIDCSTDDFYEAQADMVSRIVAPIFPYSGRYYYDDYSVIDIFGRDWNAIPGSVFEQGNYMCFDDYMAAIGGVPVSTQQYTAGSAYEAYQQVLYSYEDEMLEVENLTSVNNSTPCCALYDITGDGEDELFILYAADGENGYTSPDGGYISATLRIFTYNETSHCAVNLYTLPGAVSFGGSGIFTDVVVLDDGHLLLYSQGGDLDLYRTTFTEFAVLNGNLWQMAEAIHDNMMVEWEPEEVYEDEYYFNGNESSATAFNDYTEDYTARAETAIFVTPWYSEGDDNSEWADTVHALPSCSMTFQEALEALG